jgi:hypothetical protein
MEEIDAMILDLDFSPPEKNLTTNSNTSSIGTNTISTWKKRSKHAVSKAFMKMVKQQIVHNVQLNLHQMSQLQIINFYLLTLQIKPDMCCQVT